MNVISNHFDKVLRQESLTDRASRMLPAALYGALAAVAYTLGFFAINVYSFPALPLGLDLARLAGMMLGFGAAFALAGAIAGWFTEEYGGIVGGGVIITALLAMVFMFSTGATNATLTFQSLIMALPLVGVSMLIAWGLRRAGQIHLDIGRAADPAARRKRLARHVLVLLLVGLVPGILGRMDLPAERALSNLHQLLQAAPTDPSVLPRLPLRQLPELQAHLGVGYTFYARNSELSAGGLDVTVRFDDGFTMTCFLPMVGASGFVTDCVEGAGWPPP